jgi:proline iminopeptidase
LYLDIGNWLLYGGSWGATLALLYTQQHPSRVLGLVLRGVFLARLHDVAWFYGQAGVSRIFPREYESFIGQLEASERADPVATYYRLLTQGSRSIRELAARHWNAWEARVIRQFLPPDHGSKPPDLKEMVRRATILTHYAHHGFFLGRDGVSLDLQRFREKPCVIVHGQRDFVCPLEAAWTLHRAWPSSELHIIEEGGHVASDPAIGAALVQIFDAIAGRAAPC